MSTVLLTGATGFIGTRLVSIIKSNNHDVILLSSKEVPGEKCVLHLGYTFDKEAFQKCCDKIDTVIHLGWYVPSSGQEDVREGLGDALFNTMHLLDNLPNKPKRVIYCSSVSVYGRSNKIEYKSSSRIDENAKVCVDDEYSKSKYLGELFVKDWGRREGVDVLVLRLGPTYGPGDKRSSEFIGKIMRQALENKDITLYVNPLMKRNLIFVDDVCRFIARAIDINEGVDVINVVSDNNPTMLDIANIVVEEAKSVSNVLVTNISNYGHDLVFASYKRKEYLGDELFTLRTGIGMTIEQLRTELRYSS